MIHVPKWLKTFAAASKFLANSILLLHELNCLRARRRMRLTLPIF